MNAMFVARYRSPHIEAELHQLARMVGHRIRKAFQCQPWIDVDEAKAEAIAAAIQSHWRARTGGHDPSRFLGRLAHLAISHVRAGRHVGGSQNSRDALSERAQRLHGFKAVSLSSRFSARDFSHDGFTIADQLKDSTLRTPVPDAVAFRMDFPQFLASLTSRDRAIALFLAVGHRVGSVATRFRLSAARISQLRQQWRRDWTRMQGDPQDC
jgi:hypothetical protein